MLAFCQSAIIQPVIVHCILTQQLIKQIIGSVRLMKLMVPFQNFSMHGSILLSPTRKLLPGLRRLRALVLTTVSTENPCLQRYVVENGS